MLEEKTTQLTTIDKKPYWRKKVIVFIAHIALLGIAASTVLCTIAIEVAATVSLLTS